MPRKTHLKWDRALRLTVQIDYNNKEGHRKLQKRETNGFLQFTETTGIQAVKCGFAVIILCQICWILG